MSFFRFKMLLLWKSAKRKAIIKSKAMSKTPTGKIQNLLEQAAAQTNSSGSEASSVASSTRSFPTEQEAEQTFLHLQGKLFRIEKWNDEAGISSFALFDENGNAESDRQAVIGDFIRITLPGSGKDDWVKVIEFIDAPEETILTVQPCENPTDKESVNTVSHFFTGDSTNNFCLQKTGAKLNFYVIGLNEKTNTAETGGILETIRNVATANAGHYLGIQKAQWQTFCDSFLEIEK